MNIDLEQRYIRDLITDLQQVGSSRFERWAQPLWDRLAGGPVVARGLNPEGAPVKGVFDAIWPDGSASEASSFATYFTGDYEKAWLDYKHVRNLAPHIKTIRLFNTRVAGPKAIADIERAKTIAAKRHAVTLDVWDGRRIAEHIVRNLLVDERYVELVGDVLPSLRRIAEQNAASGRVPDQDPLYRTRSDEEVVKSALKEKICVVVHGLAGVGKTETVCAVAHGVRDDFEMVVWLDGDRVQKVEDLSAFDVRLSGFRLNVLGLLKTNRTLLVIDNALADLNTARLEAACSPGSRVLVTSQVAFGKDLVALGFVNRQVARQILSSGVTEPITEEALDRILGAVDGHALVLRLLNGLAQSGLSWDTVAAECANIVGAPDERRQTVATRILERHLDVLGDALAFFAWCDAASVDRSLFLSTLGAVGLQKLERWSLTARGQSDIVRLHDIVFASAKQLIDELPDRARAFAEKLNQYLIAKSTPKQLAFFRVVNRHRALIERLLRTNPGPGALRYAYMHGHPAVTLDPVLIGDPSADVAAGPVGDRRAWTLSVVDAIEADYRRLRDGGMKQEAKALLASRMPVFDQLVDNDQLGEGERRIARHHRAKSLLKQGEAAKALAEFEALETEAPGQHSVQLQIARLTEDEHRAKALVFGIIAAERTEPGSVAMSVLLETMGTMRRYNLRKYARELTELHGPFLAHHIKAAAHSGEDQPVRAFAAFGPDWAYHNVELFDDVLAEMDFRSPEDAEDDAERTAIGRILTAAGKAALRRGAQAEAEGRFERAVAFLEAVQKKDAFRATHLADALLRLGRAADAEVALQTAPVQQREAFWSLRASEAALARRSGEEALDRIDAGIALLGQNDDRRATFLAQRADVLFFMEDASHVAQLQEAIDCCRNATYADELRHRLQSRALE